MSAVTGAEASPERRFVFSVLQITKYLRGLLAQDRTLQDVWVRGEIGDLTASTAGSGHWYFTLKEQSSQLRCVMFREEAEGVGFVPAEGMMVVARGAVTIYEQRGQYQLVVRHLERHGVGDLYLAFERIKSKLAAEGLFDESRKRPLPAFPQRIALLTSPHGAAVHDLLTTLRRRWPLAEVVLIPTPVSGAAAAPGIVRSLRLLGELTGLEVAILARGGGSMEELSGFNAEEVAREIAASPVPVVTGIGHETDFTIAEFVADLRASTPTAAAAAAVPDRHDLLRGLQAWRQATARQLDTMVGRCRSELRLIRARPVLRAPRLLLAQRRQRVDELALSLSRSVGERLAQLRQMLERVRERLAALSPQAVLARGFSITRREDGAVVRSAAQLAVGARAEVIFCRGSARVRVTQTRED